MPPLVLNQGEVVFCATKIGGVKIIALIAYTI